MQATGRCQCGEIQYEISGDNLGLVVCFCTKCQRSSTGISTYSMPIHRNSLKVTSGVLKQWESTSDSGNRSIVHFCATCGNQIYSENPNAPEILRLKAGTLDNASDLEPDAHLWLENAPAWIQLPPDTLKYMKQSLVEELVAAIQEHRKL